MENVFMIVGCDKLKEKIKPRKRYSHCVGVSVPSKGLQGVMTKSPPPRMKD